MKLLPKNPFNQLPKLSREEKDKTEKFNSEINIVMLEAGRFAEELIEKGLMVQTLVQAPQHLVNAINKKICSTAQWRESMEAKRKMDEVSLKDLLV